MVCWRQLPAAAERLRRPERATITSTMITMITTAAMRIHSQSSDEAVELAGDVEIVGAVVGATVVGATVVGATVVGASVVGGAVVAGAVVAGAVVAGASSLAWVGRVGRVTLGAALLIALPILLAAPQPAASNATAKAAAIRTTLLVRRRMPGCLRALWKLLVAS